MEVNTIDSVCPVSEIIVLKTSLKFSFKRRDSIIVTSETVLRKAYWGKLRGSSNLEQP